REGSRAAESPEERAEVHVGHDVAVEEHERLVEELLAHRQERAGGPEQLQLVVEAHGHRQRRRPHVLVHALAEVVDVERDLGHALAGEVAELAREQRLARDLDEDLRRRRGERAEPGPVPGPEHDRPHRYVSSVAARPSSKPTRGAQPRARSRDDSSALRLSSPRRSGSCCSSSAVRSRPQPTLYVPPPCAAATSNAAATSVTWM